MDGIILEGKLVTFYCKRCKTVNLLHENSLSILNILFSRLLILQKNCRGTLMYQNNNSGKKENETIQCLLFSWQTHQPPRTGQQQLSNHTCTINITEFCRKYIKRNWINRSPVDDGHSLSLEARQPVPSARCRWVTAFLSSSMRRKQRTWTGIGRPLWFLKCEGSITVIHTECSAVQSTSWWLKLHRSQQMELPAHKPNRQYCFMI
jgi:hypothetical protein